MVLGPLPFQVQAGQDLMTNPALLSRDVQTMIEPQQSRNVLVFVKVSLIDHNDTGVKANRPPPTSKVYVIPATPPVIPGSGQP